MSYCKKLQSLLKILLGQSCKIYCMYCFIHIDFSDLLSEERGLLAFTLNYRNEAGILTARKDLDYIGRDELLEALKRVGAHFIFSVRRKSPYGS